MPASQTHRTRTIEVLNGFLTKAWASGWLPTPSLDPKALIANAMSRTGLADFGPDDFWRRSLDTLVMALEAEAGLNAVGRTIAHGQLAGILCNRLRAHALWTAHPEILERPIAAPIIVLGQMRSGTTRLQRLLACDPRFAHTRFFESWNPVPRSTARSLIDGRKVRAWAGLAMARILNPAFAAIHPTSASAVDEEIGLHSFSLCGSPFEAQWRVPSFARFCETADLAPVYREFRALLQTIGWLRGEAPGKPWILKVPQFTQDIAAVLAAFPDARLLCLDRDPAAVIGSSAALALNQMSIQSDAVDPHWIGTEWLRKIKHRKDTAHGFLATNPWVPRLDVSFARMNDDWRAEMRGIYAFLGTPLTFEAENRMARYTRRATREARHRYDLADFGLQREVVSQYLA